MAFERETTDACMCLCVWFVYQTLDGLQSAVREQRMFRMACKRVQSSSSVEIQQIRRV